MNSTFIVVLLLVFALVIGNILFIRHLMPMSKKKEDASESVKDKEAPKSEQEKN
ncbi:MAG: hypothetical protein ACFHVJ_12985 [Aestuariibacter sp.]